MPVPVHPLERALFVAVAAHLCFLPWALGTMHVWSQWISLGLASVGFVLALVPRNYREPYTRQAPFRLGLTAKLIRFPIFWLGAVGLAYVLVQALNPAWERIEVEGGWTMRPLEHVSWLPAGMQTPFEIMSPWRMLVILASGWLVTCAIWVGFTRRRALQALAIALVTNGVTFAAFAVLQQVTSNGKIYWVRPTIGQFFGAFVYRNHAAAYLNLVLALACATAAWFHVRAVRRGQRANPAVFFVFLAVVLAVSVIFSFSRGGIIGLLSTVAALSVGATIWFFRQPRENRQPLILGALLIVFGGFGAVAFHSLDASRVIDRFDLLFGGRDRSWETRQLATEAAHDMWADERWFGWGAGGFRFMFPSYQRNYPAIYRTSPKGPVLYWEYAHNDWAQVPLEFGAAGLLLLAAAAAAWLHLLTRARAWRHPFAAVALIGCLVTLLHSRGDFLFYNPAVLLTWLALLAMAAKWAEVDQ